MKMLGLRRRCRHSKRERGRIESIIRESQGYAMARRYPQSGNSSNPPLYTHQPQDQWQPHSAPLYHQTTPHPSHHQQTANNPSPSPANFQHFLNGNIDTTHYRAQQGSLHHTRNQPSFQEYQPWSTSSDSQTSWSALNDLTASRNFISGYCREPSNAQSSVYSNTGLLSSLERSYSPFGSTSESGSENSTPNFPQKEFGARSPEITRFSRSQGFFLPQQSPVGSPGFTEPIREYNPFGAPVQREFLESQPRIRPEQDAIGTKSKRSYSDVIKTAGERDSHRLTESRSLPLVDHQRPTSSTPPPYQKPRRRPVKAKSTDDMPTCKSETDPSNRQAEKENVRLNTESKRTDSNDVTDGFKKVRSRTFTPETTTKPAQNETEPQKVFFDPKRIFQPQKTVKPQKAPEKTDPSSPTPPVTPPQDDQVLNNGKFSASGFTNANKTPTYINNDLRNRAEPRKKNNASQSTPGPEDSIPSSSPREYVHKNRPENSEAPRSGYGNERTRNKPDESKQRSKGESRKNAHERPNRKRKSQENVPAAWIFAEQAWKWSVVMFWKYGWPAIKFVPIIAFKVLLLLLSILLYYVMKGYVKVRPYLNFKRFLPKLPSFGWSKSSKPSYGPRGGAGDAGRGFGCGLECNITLPSTGEEAINRLLGCQGKDDPYCILGLHGQCTDDDIKRYYRKQAILVHPDKNSQPGAEEAFKILHCAFEQIGSPEKRRLFDEQMHESKAAEEAAKQFGDLLTKLEAKLREAANRMRCDKCNGFHQREPVDRSIYAARFCSKCQERHMAKEGDCWAEATMFGFYWRYYACMDGKIYNITEWAKCQHDIFERMRPNSHHVIYVLATGSNNRHNRNKPSGGFGPGQSPGNGGRGDGNINEKDLEDLLKFMASGGQLPKDFQRDPGATGSSADPNNHHSNQQKKKTKNKKKRR